MMFSANTAPADRAAAARLLLGLASLFLKTSPFHLPDSRFLCGFPAARASRLSSGHEVFTDFQRVIAGIEVTMADVSRDPKFLGLQRYVLRVRNSNGTFFLQSVMREIRAYVDEQSSCLANSSDEGSQKIAAMRINKTWEAFKALQVEVQSLQTAASKNSRTWTAWASSFFTSSYKEAGELLAGADADLRRLGTLFSTISSRYPLVQPPC